MLPCSERQHLIFTALATTVAEVEFITLTHHIQRLEHMVNEVL